MTKRAALLTILLFSSVSVYAADPSWNVRDAAEKLLDKHALRLPVDDWFLERTDGSIVQHFKPSITYTGRGAYWTAEVRTTRWRERKDGKWGAWNYAGNSDYFRTAVIEVQTPSTGGAFAKFKGEKNWFAGYRTPGQSRVTHVR